MNFGRPFILHFFTHPQIFLPVHNRFYASKWQVDGSLCIKLYTGKYMPSCNTFWRIYFLKVCHLFPPEIIHTGLIAIHMATSCLDFMWSWFIYSVSDLVTAWLAQVKPVVKPAGELSYCCVQWLHTAQLVWASSIVIHWCSTAQTEFTPEAISYCFTGG